MTVNYDSETFSFRVIGDTFEFHIIEMNGIRNQYNLYYWGNSEDDAERIERQCTELYDDLKRIDG